MRTRSRSSFPDDVPLPTADYQITQSLEESSGSGASVHVTLGVQAAADDLTQELEAGFAANGWEAETTSRTSVDGSAQVVLAFAKADAQAILMILSDGGDETVVSYTLGRDS